MSFPAGEDTFILLTAHINFGNNSADRIPELEALAKWPADWAAQTDRFHHNLLVLGDFNIDRKDNDLWKDFIGTGLRAPADLDSVKRTVFVKDGDDPKLDKFYDQIAWFDADSDAKKAMQMRYRLGGGFDFLPFVYPDQSFTVQNISYRISDHYPLWCEFERRKL